MAYKPQILKVSEGGTGANTLTGVLTGNGTSAITGNSVTQYSVVVGGTSNAIGSVGPGLVGQVLQSAGIASNPAYSTATYPLTTTINQILYSSASNTISGLATGNNGILITGTTGVPSILANGTTGQVLTATTGSPPSWANPATSGTVTSVSGTANQVSVATGTTTPVISLVGPYTPATYGAHTVIVGEGTSSMVGIGPGTSGQVFQSGGASADPTYSTATYPATTTANQILYSSSTNTIGGLTSGNSLLAATNASGTLAMRSFSVVRQVFTTGTGTYTPTTGMLYCDIEVVGGGGGSGGCPTTAVNYAVSGSGGGGGYAKKVFSAATIGASQSYAVGAGGTAGTTGANAGGQGGTTSVGSTLISATGGAGGAAGTAATGGETAGGAGGAGSSGDFNTNGTPGTPGIFDTTGSVISQGSGGSSYFGGGALGAAGGSAATAGVSAGGGASSSSQGPNQSSTIPGAAGAKGIIIITEYCIN